MTSSAALLGRGPKPRRGGSTQKMTARRPEKAHREGVRRPSWSEDNGGKEDRRDMPIFLALLTLATNLLPPDAALGEATASVGRVTIERGGRTYCAGPGAAIYPGDRLETGAGAGAGVFLYEGHVLALGPAASAALPGQAEPRLITLDRGEA